MRTCLVLSGMYHLRLSDRKRHTSNFCTKRARSVGVGWTKVGPSRSIGTCPITRPSPQEGSDQVSKKTSTPPIPL